MSYLNPPNRRHAMAICHSSTGRGMTADTAYLRSGEGRQVLVLDDRLPFRRAVASSLKQEQIEVFEAAGVYDALQRIDRPTIGAIVVRGDLNPQSGWRCAAKLCGAPPWHGVIMHFDRLTAKERTWARASGLTLAMETAGQPHRVVETVLQVLGATTAEPAAYPPLRS